MPAILRIGPYRFYFYSNEKGEESRHISMCSENGFLRSFVQTLLD